ncbi:Guanine nucleotide exchange factor VAV2 [Schistosoma japonicum]|nr:Guanine nucleotide exchange factor VAV2 [Schistosoma japonicum]
MSSVTYLKIYRYKAAVLDNIVVKPICSLLCSKLNVIKLQELLTYLAFLTFSSYSVIDNYSKVSLNRCFDEVDITLLYPYQKCPCKLTTINVSSLSYLVMYTTVESTLPLFYVRANFDFHDKSNSRFLNLKGGDRIAVVSRAAEDRGRILSDVFCNARTICIIAGFTNKHCISMFNIFFMNILVRTHM